MKSTILILTVTTLLFTACDYQSILFIENNKTESIQIKTEGNPIQEYANLKLLKEENNAYLYELKEESQHYIIQLINEDIVIDKIPYSRLEIYTSTDTIIFKDQIEILDNMIKVYDNYFKISVN